MSSRILGRTVERQVGETVGEALGVEGGLEEVVVTAQKREQALSDVSLSVTAFTGDTMRTLNFKEPRDLTGVVANLDMKGTQGDINPAVTIRGVGLNNFNANNNPTVGMYVDEVFLSSAAMMTLMMSPLRQSSRKGRKKTKSQQGMRILQQVTKRMKLNK